MRFYLIHIVFTISLFGCQGPSGPIFIGDPPKAISEAEKNCLIISEVSHPKEDIISGALQNSEATQFANLLPELKTKDALLYRLLSNAKGPRTYTFFMPTDDAWEKFRQTHPNFSISGDTLEALVKQHIMVEYIPYQNLLDGLPVASSLNASIVRFSQDDRDCVLLNESSYVKIVEDVCSNGVIHLIDRVLIPDQIF